jgi:glutathione synthase/RimK-type ligase-like ATP-grasp enzyme
LGGISPLNDAGAAGLCTDKFYTALALAAAGWRVPVSCRCLAAGVFRDEYEAMTGVGPALAFAEAHGYPLIVKPNRGSRGRHVQVVTDEQGLRAAIAAVWEREYLALVQIPAPGIDLRLDFLDGEFVFGYLRRPLRIAGDGSSTIAELLRAADPRFAEPGFLDAAEVDPLWRPEWTRESVPAAGEGVEFATPVLNLNRLCVAERVRELDPAWAELGRRIGERLRLRHYGVDFKIRDIADDPDEAVVLEVNASPSLSHMSRMGYLDDALAVEKRIVAAMFATQDAQTSSVSNSAS